MSMKKMNPPYGTILTKIQDILIYNPNTHFYIIQPTTTDKHYYVTTKQLESRNSWIYRDRSLNIIAELMNEIIEIRKELEDYDNLNRFMAIQKTLFNGMGAALTFSLKAKCDEEATKAITKSDEETALEEALVIFKKHMKTDDDIANSFEIYRGARHFKIRYISRYSISLLSNEYETFKKAENVLELIVEFISLHEKNL